MRELEYTIEREGNPRNRNLLQAAQWGTIPPGWSTFYRLLFRIKRACVPRVHALYINHYAERLPMAGFSYRQIGAGKYELYIHSKMQGRQPVYRVDKQSGKKGPGSQFGQRRQIHQAPHPGGTGLLWDIFHQGGGHEKRVGNQTIETAAETGADPYGIKTTADQALRTSPGSGCFGYMEDQRGQK